MTFALFLFLPLAAREKEESLLSSHSKTFFGGAREVRGEWSGGERRYEI